MRSLLLALQFLTILPIHIKGEVRKEDLTRSMLFYPMIGLLLGIILAILCYGLSQYLPFYSAIAILIVIYIILTGGLHLDAFADLCDGFYAGKTKEDILKIMKDPHIGTIGAIGIFCIIFLKFILLVNTSSTYLLVAIAIAPIIGRWSAVLMSCRTKYVSESGVAQFIEGIGFRELIYATIATMAFLIAIAQVISLIVILFALILTLLFKSYVKSKIDGVTGDTLGACIEINEIATLLIMLLIGRA